MTSFAGILAISSNAMKIDQIAGTEARNHSNTDTLDLIINVSLTLYCFTEVYHKLLKISSMVYQN